MRGHREEKGPLKGVRGVQARPAAAHRELSIAGVPTQLHTLFILNMNINEGLLKYNHSSPRMQQPPGQSVSPHRLHARVLVLPQTCLVLSAKNQLAAHCPPLGSPTNLCLCCACVSVCVCVCPSVSASQSMQASVHCLLPVSLRCLPPCLSVCTRTVNPRMPFSLYPSIESCAITGVM